MKLKATSVYKILLQRKFFCQWIENYIFHAREMKQKAQDTSYLLALPSTEPTMQNISPQNQQYHGGSQKSRRKQIELFKKDPSTLLQTEGLQQLQQSLPSQEQELMKNIVSLSGQKNRKIATDCSQTVSQDFTVAMSPLHSDIEQGIFSEQPLSLERSYQKRRKLNALYALSKKLEKNAIQDYNNRQSLYQYAEEAFLKWKQLTLRDLKTQHKQELFINQWIVAFDHCQSRKLTKAFYALRSATNYLRQVEVKELNLRVREEERLLSATFFQWISTYNLRVDQRQLLYQATEFWAERSQKKHFRKWSVFISAKQNDRLKFRNYVLVNCVTTLLSRGVPKDILKKQQSVRSEIETLVSIRPLKHSEEAIIDQTVDLYEMQVKAVLFDQFKSNYYRMSQFKAEKTIRVLSSVIGAWRKHTASKKAFNDKQEAFLEVRIFKKYQRILVDWQQHALKMQILKRRLTQYTEGTQLDIKQRYFQLILVQTQANLVKKGKIRLGKQFHSTNLLSKAIVALDHYKQLSSAKRNYQTGKNYLIEMFKMKRILDKFVKQTCQRKHCKEAQKMLTRRKNLASRKHLFTEWLLGAFSFRRANIFYAKRAMARGLNWLQLGIANQTHTLIQQSRAKSFRTRKLKQNFIFTLRESLLCIKIRSHTRKQTVDEVKYRRLVRLFRGFQQYAQYVLNRAQQLLVARDIHKTLRKKHVLLSLRRYTHTSQSLKVFAYQKNFSLAKGSFLLLQHAVSKQRSLRASFVEFGCGKYKKLVHKLMKHWLCSAVQKTMRRNSLEERTAYFQRLRFFKYLKLQLTSARFYKSQLQEHCYSRQQHVQRKCLQAWGGFIKSRDHLNRRKAQAFCKYKLLHSPYEKMKKLWMLKKIQELVTHNRKKQELQQFYNLWSQAFFTLKVKFESLVYLQRKKVQTVLKAWRQAINCKKENLEMHSEALALRDQLSKRRLLRVLSNNILQNKEDYKKKLRQQEQADLVFLKNKLTQWNLISKRRACFQAIENQVLRIRAYKIVKKHYALMREIYKNNCVVKRHIRNKQLRITEQVFRLIKKKIQSKRNNQKLLFQRLSLTQNRKTSCIFKILREKALKHRQQTKKLKLAKGCMNKSKLAKYFCTLKHRRARKLTLRSMKNKCQIHLLKSFKLRVIKRLVQEAMGRKLYKQAELYHKTKVFQKLQKKLLDRKENLDRQQEQEVKALSLLVAKIEKKAITAWKVFIKFSLFKKKMRKSAFMFGARKWFDQWRSNYGNRNNLNYLNDNLSDVSFNGSKSFKIMTSPMTDNQDYSGIQLRDRNANSSYLQTGGFLGRKKGLNM